MTPKGYKYKVYRVGGDEFNAIVFNCNEDNVKEIIKIMDDTIKSSGYNVSFGYSMNNMLILKCIILKRNIIKLKKDKLRKIKNVFLFLYIKT